MKPLALVRVLALLSAAAVVATACAASETVIIADSVVESATATARQSLPDPAESAISGSASDVATAADEPTETPDEPTETAEAPTSAPVAAGSGNAGTIPSADDEPCVYEGVDSFGDMQIALAFTGPPGERSDTSVDYEVFDASGESLVARSYFVEELAPGEMVRISIDTVTDEPSGRTGGNGITCEITNVASSSFGSASFAPQPGDSCTFVEVDSFDDIQIRIDVVSPLDTDGELFIAYALRGPDGIRFEADSVFSDDIVSPGEVSSNAVDTFTEFPAWVNESTFTCEVLSIEEF